MLKNNVLMESGQLPSSELKNLASVLPPLGLHVAREDNGERAALAAEACGCLPPVPDWIGTVKRLEPF